MPNDQLCPPAGFREGEETFGFRLTRVTRVEEIRATAYEAVHLKTGAQVLHLHCADRENLYAITLRTPPPDSTGVPHILEHSVLAGSKKYPVKDAFTELGKGSLKTFINAFTAPDFTCYPVASQARADFYNLASVYTDLVFNPLLSKTTFMQEGHRLEVNEQGDLEISGIVYNEMKGAFSTVESVAERTTIQALQPDTPYGHESGGDPEHIPDLTHEAFCEFHRRYYSPSNSRIFFYGDIPTADHLHFLAGQLDGFERCEVDSQVPAQPAWKGPRTAEGFFPIGPEEQAEGRSIINLAWLTADAADAEQRLILQVLEEALVGSAAAPLRKALIDSGLGQDLSPTTGLDTSFRQAPFVVGLRNTDPDKAEAVEKVALSKLVEVARDGLPHDLLEGAYHQVEFAGLEIRRMPYIFPLKLLFRSLSAWLHDQDPLTPLRFPTLMAGLKERWRREPDLFQQAVRRWFVENPHRLRAVVAPSRTLTAEQAERVRRRLDLRRAAMSEEDLSALKAEVEALLESQRTADAPEALATLPVLSLQNVPREVEKIPSVERTEGGGTVLEHEVFTNGIAYVDVVFDVSGVPEELQGYLPLLGAAATEMGAAGFDYEAFATRKALRTGGITSEQRARDRLRGEGTAQFFCLRGKALREDAGEMVKILGEIITRGDLADAARLNDVLAEARNALRAQVAPRGHLFSWRSAAAGLSLAGHRDEQWHGATQVRLLYKLAQDFGREPAGVQEKLARLREIIFRRTDVIVNLTGDRECLEALGQPVAELLRILSPGKDAPDSPSALVFPQPPGRIGVSLPGRVCYVARVLPVPKYNDPGAPEVLVLANHLGDGILYRKIRVEGGAYGGMAMYNHALGQFAMVSYRDPNLEKTLEIYDACLDELLAEDLSADAVRKAVISTIANLDRPMDPATQAIVALERRLAGMEDADRQRFREGVLRVDAAAMRNGVREILKPALSRARDAVFAPTERIEAANRGLRHPFEIGGLE